MACNCGKSSVQPLGPNTSWKSATTTTTTPQTFSAFVAGRKMTFSSRLEMDAAIRRSNPSKFN